MLEPVEEAMNSYEQNLRFKWVPQRRSSGSINLLTNPKGLLDVMEVEPKMRFNCETGTRIDDYCLRLCGDGRRLNRDEELEGVKLA